jgi:hypothetical protein
MSISKRKVKLYCKEFENIENYQKAISSTGRWDCHHRNEIDMNLSVGELKEQGLYYNRPASELIFLTHEAHLSLHNKGKNNSMYGKHHSIESRKKMSDAQKGENNPLYGKHRSAETKKKISESNKKFICPIKLTYMYCKQKMSADAIAREFGVDGNTIRRHLRELNIPIRKR